MKYLTRRRRISVLVLSAAAIILIGVVGVMPNFHDAFLNEEKLIENCGGMVSMQKQGDDSPDMVSFHDTGSPVVLDDSMLSTITPTLRRFTSLRILNLSDTRVTPKAIAVIIPKLQRLNMLILSPQQIDAQVRAIAAKSSISLYAQHGPKFDLIANLPTTSEK